MTLIKVKVIYGDNMPKFTQENKKKIYFSLLDQGELLFTQKGFFNVTAEEIALSAGIAKGTFYHFFDNKEHLYMVINNTLQKKIFEHVKDMIAGLDTSRQSEMLYETMCYILESFVQNPIIFSIDFVVWKRIEEKAPRECIEENNKRDLQMIQLVAQSGLSFRYDLETTTQIIQMQFVQFAAMQHHPNSLELEKIVLKALSEHLISDTAD